MKKLIVGLLAALAVGAAAGSVLIENASARGYTCSYATTKAKGIYYTIHGADNKPKYCRVIARPGYRRVSRVAGRTYCVFAMTQMDVRMTLRATNGYAGRFLCSGLETMLSGGWQPRAVSPRNSRFSDLFRWAPFHPQDPAPAGV